MTPRPLRSTLFPYTTLFRSKSIDFYKDIGLQLKQRWDNHYAQVEAPGVVIGLHPAKEETNTSTAISIGFGVDSRSEEHTSELQSHSDLVCRLLLEKKKLREK